MKKNFDRDEMLDEILSPEELRAASLARTLSAARRQRRLSRGLRGAGVIAVVGLIAALGWPRPHPSPQPPLAAQPPTVVASPSTPKIVPGTNIREVTDDELLAMFPDRPVALVGPPQHRQFVFLDQQRSAKSPKRLNL